MKFLVDTNIVSEMRKGRDGNSGVVAWSGSVDMSDLAISVLCLKELEYGVLNVAGSDPLKSLVLRAYLDHFVIPQYRGRVLPVDEVIAIRAAALDVPKRRPFADGLIAATALVHDLTVVTRNTVDFLPTGVRLLNPFT